MRIFTRCAHWTRLIYISQKCRNQNSKTPFFSVKFQSQFMDKKWKFEWVAMFSFSFRQFHHTFFAALMYILYDIVHNRPFWGACRASWWLYYSGDLWGRKMTPVSHLRPFLESRSSRNNFHINISCPDSRTTPAAASEAMRRLFLRLLAETSSSLGNCFGLI